MNIGNGITIILFVLKSLIALSFIILITRILKEGIIKSIFKILTQIATFIVTTIIFVELSFKISYYIGSIYNEGIFITNFIYYCLLLVSLFVGIKISIPLSNFFIE